MNFRIRRKCGRACAICICCLVAQALHIQAQQVVSRPVTHPADQSTRYVHSFPAMGVTFRVVAYASSPNAFRTACDQVVQRVQQLDAVFSNYSQFSEAMQLTATAPHPNPVSVSDDLYHVCTICNRVHHQSGGAFDASIGGVAVIWRMARKRNRLPDPADLKRAMQSVGWNRTVRLFPDNKILLPIAGTQLDFGGIAKGYAADQGLLVFRQHHIHSALVDAGGDLAVGEKPPDAEAWIVEVHSVSPAQPSPKLFVVNCGVATSGDAHQRLVKNGIRYSHLLDPRTGNAVENAPAVTVVAPTASLADAWASAISVLGSAETAPTLSNHSQIDYRIEWPGDQNEHRELRSETFGRWFVRP